MSTSADRLAAAGLAGLALGLVPGAGAAAADFKPGLEVIQHAALGLEGEDADMARLEILPKLDVRFDGGWRADIALRIEASGADVGLGSDITYADISRPLSLGPDAQAEIEEATLSWRQRSTRLTFGKQTMAWGVLDGLQVTDRFDAVRRREAVFIDQRPDRIARWGARAEFDAAGVRWDLAAHLDGTADQFARPGETYAVAAPRLRAGLPAGAPLPNLVGKPSGEPTLGVRAERRFGASDASVLVIHGPDTEPVFRPDPAGVALEYDTRTLVGATWQTSSGPRVWRLEAAWIGDQSVNLQGPGLADGERDRWLAGGGLDWSLPDNTLLNVQLAADHVEGEGLVRPSTDVIGTMKLRKPLANERWTLGAEVLGSLSDGDGAVRPSAAWQVSDEVRLEAGADVVWGDADGLFGQYEDADRVWLRARWSI